MRRLWWVLLLVPALVRAQEDGQKWTFDVDFLQRGEFRDGGLALHNVEEGGTNRAAVLLG